MTGKMESEVSNPECIFTEQDIQQISCRFHKEL